MSRASIVFTALVSGVAAKECDDQFYCGTSRTEKCQIKNQNNFFDAVKDEEYVKDGHACVCAWTYEQDGDMVIGTTSTTIYDCRDENACKETGRTSLPVSKSGELDIKCPKPEDNKNTTSTTKPEDEDDSTSGAVVVSAAVVLLALA